jgi:hypothetical protein
VITPELNNWLEKLITEDDLVANVYPYFGGLTGEAWAKSELGQTSSPNNGLSGEFPEMNAVNRHEVETMIRVIHDKDLVDILSVGTHELEARRGLALLQQTSLRVTELKERCTNQLRKIQSIRDVAAFEMERRARVKMIAEGVIEPMPPFNSRFLFGPPPPSMVASNHMSAGPKKKHFFIAQVKSGKQVAVEHLRFDIPHIYYTWVLDELKKAQLVNINTPFSSSYYEVPPSLARWRVARRYYQLGFKPKNTTTGHYSIHWHDTGWNDGWYLRRGHSFETTALIPVD